MVAWSEAVAEYEEREGKRLAESTIKNYMVTLRAVTKMLNDKAISRTTETDLENVLWAGDDSFRARGLMNSVVNARADHLKTFMAWCRVRGYIHRDITDNFKKKKLRVRKQARRQLDADLLLDALDATRNPRDRILLAAITFDGQRISDHKEFRLRDLDLRANVIQGEIVKTNKEYYAKMGPELRAEMNVWLDYYAKELGYISADALLADVRKRRLDWYLIPRMTRPVLGGYKTVDTSNRTILPDQPINNVYHMLRKIFADIGLEDAKGEGFHTLRRSAARHMYNRAVEREGSKDRAMRMVQVYLNHSTMAQTEKYVGFTVERDSLNEMIEDTSLLGDAYENRYGSASSDNVIPFHARKGRSA